MSDWNCKKCTCSNSEDAERCQVCGEPREEEEEEYDGSSGGEEEEEEEEEEFDELRASKGFDDVVGSALAKEAKKKVGELASSAKKKLGNAITLIEDEDSCVIRSALSVKFLDPTIAKVWGIKYEKPIILELKFDLENYSDKPPQFILYQSADTDLSRYKLKDISSFGLEWQLRARLDDWLNGDKKTSSKPNWPPKDNNFIESILQHVEERVKSCTSSCIICDGALPFQMIKPAVCEKDLCVHAHEQYGLGADVASEIRDFPDVVDLLISFCYAISGGDQRRFNPYPIGVEAKKKDDQGKEVAYDFMADDKKTKNPSAIRKVMDLYPSVSDLGKYADTKSLKTHLDSLDPLAFPLLRWIITSNRAHLDRLQEKDMIKEMNTPYQYMFLSSPPEKEALFQKLKKEKGSFWAFHGSSFANWHSILRIGLKNYSNTPLMSTGAAYGAGIYLAPQSSTSVGYAVSQAGWEKSIFSNDKGSYNNLQCLALCEVINNGYKANPHYVVPDENHVMTRYFFIYNSKHTAPSVQAEGLKNVKSSPLAEKS